MLEFLFSFLTTYAPALSVFLFSIIILVIINIFYRVLVNQAQVKQIKQRIKELNDQSNTARKAGDMEKSKKLMSDMLSENSKMMKMNMKPMIISLVVVVILLPSLGVFYGDKTVAQDATNVTLSGTTYQLQSTNNTLVIGGSTCQLPCSQVIGPHTYKITPQGSGAKFAMIVAVLPVSLPFLGNTFGWFGWYLICSIPLVIIIRKFMKIYM